MPELKQQLTTLQHNYLTDQTLDIDDKWNTWYKQIMEAINRHIPQKKLGKTDTPPWIDLECLKLIRKKNRTLSRAKKSKNPETEKKFRVLRNRIKNLINHKARIYVNNLCENLYGNPKKFWSFLKTKTKSNSLPQILRTINGIEAKTDLEKANLLNDYFYSTFNQHQDLPLPNIIEYNDPELNSINLDITEVSKELKNINTNKAIGPDGIPSIVLKECHHELSPSLCQIFNLSLKSGIVPNAWKCANIVPVYKKGNVNITSNYRPVSLLSVISKILERLIYNKIITNILPKITSKQHGFMPSKSTITQLLATFTEVNTNIDTGRRTDIIYFDLAKAFDSVPHNLLTHKLKQFGFNGPLLNWMTNNLLNRKQRVIVNGSHSKWSSVASGVPQGATLGPLNFLLYVNDLPNSLNMDTECGVFADDTQILRDIKTNKDIETLQNDINALYTWSIDWGLKFNETKCKVLSIRKALTIDQLDSPNYQLNNIKLESTTTIQDLGITIDNQLSWSNHIYTTIRKAHSRSWLCMRALGFHAHQRAKKTTYITMVRSILEYGSPIWSPTYKYLITALESIQRRATNYILNNPKRPSPLHIDYKQRLQQLKLLPLTFRREILDLKTFLKIWNSPNKLGLDKLLQFSAPSEGRVTRAMASGLTLKYTKTRLATTAHFYPYRISMTWNKLPYNMRLSLRYLTDSEKIKRILNQYYYARLSERFDPINTCTWVTHCDCNQCKQM